MALPDVQTVIRRIRVENLLIDEANPRYESNSNQRNAIFAIANEQRDKLANLAEDIVKHGLNPSELPIVTRTNRRETYKVLEGNRRVAALKLLSSPSLVEGMDLPARISKRFKSLGRRKKRIPTEIDCAVQSTHAADHWRDLRHTGENEGVGVVQWNGLQTHRFRGASVASQAIEMAASSAYLDDATKAKLPKISITNVERVLHSPEARKRLGVDIKRRQLKLVEPRKEPLARLAMLVADVAHKAVKVSHLMTVGQRIAYAQEVAERPVSTPVQTRTGVTGQPGSSSPGTATSGETARRVPVNRKTLIPKSCVLKITHKRINKIYHELQKLDLTNFVNCAATALRVFVELSAVHFADSHNIQLTGKKGHPLKLREKIKAVCHWLETQGGCNRDELKGARVLASGTDDNVLSVDTIHAYLHNRHFNPTGPILKTIWDNIEPFMKAVWR
jgi:hypothetical protein